MNRVCKLEKPHLFTPKFTTFWMLVEYKMRNNFTFGIKFKLETELK
jgi:hypothetical protein